MKRNDARNFCILYLEPGDDRDALFRAISGQHKPVVLMLAQQSRLFQHPEEFVALKHLKRELNVAIFFVIASGERLAQIESISATPLAHLDYISAEMKGRLAERNGFPVYKSMDALNDALMVGNSAPQHILSHAAGESTSAAYRAPRKTVPLTPLEEIVAHMQ